MQVEAAKSGRIRQSERWRHMKKVMFLRFLCSIHTFTALKYVAIFAGETDESLCNPWSIAGPHGESTKRSLKRLVSQASCNAMVGQKEQPVAPVTQGSCQCQMELKASEGPYRSTCNVGPKYLPRSTESCNGARVLKMRVLECNQPAPPPSRLPQLSGSNTWSCGRGWGLLG